MQKVIAGYQIIELVYESANSQIYRACRPATDQRVILKLLKDPFPPPEKIAWFKREYDIIRSLQGIPGVIAVYELETDHHQWFMVLEECGGVSLAHMLTTLPQMRTGWQDCMGDFLALALEITAILGRIHQHQVIHKDINPANILAVPPARTHHSRQHWGVKLIDFGIATKLSGEHVLFGSPQTLEGTLAYIAPEQTGRMNRSIDQRADLYSLGVTFYELLTGQVPFVSDDPLEAIHAHIARPPIPPQDVNSVVPATLGQIVLRLLAKCADERYQSAAGLRADLEVCLWQWQESQRIPAFVLGQKDRLDKLRIPQQLYGREEQVNLLMEAFERVCLGRKELMLVAGAAGIGKSVLVQEIYKPVTQAHGYFIRGKFDQLLRDTPYSALIQAFGALIQYLLTEGSAEVGRWRTRLLAALGNNGQVMIEVIPELALIIGPQPAVPALEPIERLNRFQLTFQNFVQVFTQEEHPLVLFLDDLQWADSASLKLLTHLLTHSASRHLLCILAYRDTEISLHHPLLVALDEIKQSSIRVTTLGLPPLETEQVTWLLADMLGVQPDDVRPLADAVRRKSGGNPFFLHEFIKSLNSEGLIHFDHTQARWQWELLPVQQRDITANVVELLTERARQLPVRTQELLKLAACVSYEFRLDLLAVVAERNNRSAAMILWPSIAVDLIVPLDHTYMLIEVEAQDQEQHPAPTHRFAHDRVRQAIYALIDDDKKQSIHYRIGHSLLRTWTAEEQAGQIFTLVNHLNIGRALLTSQAERDTVAELNLRAGKRAQASAAYQDAFIYLQTGLQLLTYRDEPIGDGQDCWGRQYDLALQLHTATAEAAYLSGHFDIAEQLIATVLAHARTLFDQIPIYEIQIQACFAQNRLLEAVQYGLAVLDRLHVVVPRHPAPAEVLAVLQETQAQLEQTDLQALLALPTMTDPDALAALSLINRLFAPVFMSMPQVLPLLICTQVQLSLVHGKAPETGLAFAYYGVVLCGGGNLDAAYQAGQLAMQLVDVMGARAVQARTYLFNALMLNHWKQPLHASRALFAQAYQSGVETGDLDSACNALVSQAILSLLTGQELTAVEREMASAYETVAGFKQSAYLQFTVFWQLVLNLLGQAADALRLQGAVFDEDAMIPLYTKDNNLACLFISYFCKLLLCFLFQDFRQAVAHADRVEAYLVNSSFGSMYYTVLFYFLDSLVRLAVYAETPAPAQEALLQKVLTNYAKLQAWSMDAPENGLHRLTLVEAELARVRDQTSQAREHYDRAIDLASKHQYWHEGAMACELAARFYQAQGQKRLTYYYIQEAHYLYKTWGAQAKVQDLEKHYPNLLIQSVLGPSYAATLTDAMTTKDFQAVRHLDIHSVIKASQAIAGEILLENLLPRLLDVVIENAGAERGILLLPRGGRWVVEIERWSEKESARLWSGASVSTGATPLTIINYVARTRNPLVLHHAAQEGPFTPDPYILIHQTKSVLCLPLLHQSQFKGMIYLENNMLAGAFSPDRLQVLNLLTGQIAISLENAGLYADLQSSERKYRTVFEDSKDTIFIISPTGEVLDISPSCRMLFGHMRDELQRTQMQDWYVNPEDYARFCQKVEAQSSVKDFETQLRRKDGVVIDCLITAVAQRDNMERVVSFLGIIRDITQQKRAEQERLRLTAVERELMLAQSIQSSLLPPPRPQIAGLELICHSQPAREVGGDLYTYYIFSASASSAPRIGVAVGDVTGKGMPAALMMAVSLAAFTSVVEQGLRPKELLAAMDRALITHMRTTRQNCALVYVEITQNRTDEQRAAPLYTLCVANAAGVTPLIKRRTGRVEWVDAGGPPLGLGLGNQAGYAELVLDLYAGDMLILTSDGVIEATRADGTLFSFERLEEAVASAPPYADAEALLLHLRRAVEAFAGNVEQHDDITIVVIRV